MSTAIRAGKAFYEIFAHDKTKAGLEQASKRLKSFGAGVVAAGAALTATATAGLVAFRKSADEFARFGDSIDKFSGRTGINTDWAQALAVAAELGGASIRDVEAAIKRMQRTLAKTGELAGLLPEEQFLAIADEIARIEDPTLRAAKAMEYFGRSGTMILPMLANGAAGLRKQLDDLRSGGLLLSPQDVKMAAELNDAWTMLRLSMSMSVRFVGAAVAEDLIFLLKTITAGIRIVAQFVNANRGLFRTIAAGLVIMLALGSVLMVVGGAFLALGMLMAAIPLILVGMKIAAIAFGAALGLLISPMVLLPALAYALDRAFAGGKGLATMIAGFKELWRIASQTIGGIVDALTAGNWQLAASIASTGITLAFSTAWANIKIGLVNFLAFVAKKVIDFFGNDFVGIVAGGVKKVIDLVNQASEALGGGTLVDTTKMDAAIESIKAGTMGSNLDQAAAEYAAAQQAELAAMQTVLDALTAEAAKKDLPKEVQRSGRLGDAMSSDRISLEAKSQGAFLGAAFARMGMEQVQFSPLEDKLDETNDLLEQIKRNTDDMGEEFGE